MRSLLLLGPWQVLRWAASVNGTQFPATLTLKAPPGAGSRAREALRKLPWHQRVAQQVGCHTLLKPS
jgi:hypothetical protein